MLLGSKRIYQSDNNLSVIYNETGRPASCGTHALFGDGGNVYPRAGLTGLRDLHGDGGFGIRIKNKQTTGDGRSHEQMSRMVARATAATPQLDAGYLA
jgi:hypothetical protein